MKQDFSPCGSSRWTHDILAGPVCYIPSFLFTHFNQERIRQSPASSPGDRRGDGSRPHAVLPWSTPNRAGRRAGLCSRRRVQASGLLECWVERGGKSVQEGWVSVGRKGPCIRPRWLVSVLLARGRGDGSHLRLHLSSLHRSSRRFQVVFGFLDFRLNIQAGCDCGLHTVFCSCRSRHESIPSWLSILPLLGWYLIATFLQYSPLVLMKPTPFYSHRLTQTAQRPSQWRIDKRFSKLSSSGPQSSSERSDSAESEPCTIQTFKLSSSHENSGLSIVIPSHRPSGVSTSTLAS